MHIPTSVIEQALTEGWTNLTDLDIQRLVASGRTITCIISDAPFTVPSTLPGGATTIASKQYTLLRAALLLIRLISRGE